MSASLIDGIRVIANPQSNPDEANQASEFVLGLRNENVLQFINDLIEIISKEDESQSIHMEALILMRNTLQARTIEQRNAIRESWLQSETKTLADSLKKLMIEILFSDEIQFRRIAASIIAEIICIEDYSPEIFGVFLETAQTQRKGISLLLYMTELFRTDLYSRISLEGDTSIPETFSLICLSLENIQQPENLPEEIDSSFLNEFIILVIDAFNGLLDSVPGFIDSPDKVNTFLAASCNAFGIADPAAYQRLYQTVNRIAKEYYSMSNNFREQLCQIAVNGFSAEAPEFATTTLEFWEQLIDDEQSLYAKKFPSFYNDLSDWKPENFINKNEDDESFQPMNIIYTFIEDRESFPKFFDNFLHFIFQNGAEIDTEIAEASMNAITSLFNYYPPIAEYIISQIQENISSIDYRAVYAALTLAKSICRKAIVENVRTYISEIFSQYLCDLVSNDTLIVVGTTLELVQIITDIGYYPKEKTDFVQKLLEMVSSINPNEDAELFENAIKCLTGIFNGNLKYNLVSEYFPDVLSLMTKVKMNDTEKEAEELKISVIYAIDDLLITLCKHAPYVMSLVIQTFDFLSKYIEGIHIIERDNSIERMSSSLWAQTEILIIISRYEESGKEYSQRMDPMIKFMLDLLGTHDIMLYENIFLIFQKLLQEFGKILDGYGPKLLEAVKEALGSGNTRLMKYSIRTIGYIFKILNISIPKEEVKGAMTMIFQLLQESSKEVMDVIQPDLIRCINFTLIGFEDRFDGAMLNTFISALSEMMAYTVDTRNDEERELWCQVYKEIIKSIDTIIKIKSEYLDNRDSPLYITKILLFIKKKISAAQMYDQGVLDSFVDLSFDIIKKDQKNGKRIINNRTSIELYKIAMSFYEDQTLYLKTCELLNKFK